MNGLENQIRRFRENRNLGDLLKDIPYANFLGLQVEIVDGRVRVTMPFSQHLVGNPGLPALHGGTLGGTLESVCIFQILWESETLFLPKTINMTVDYLRSGRPEDTYAECFITKHGRRVVNVRAEAWQSDRDKPIAAVNAHFLIQPIADEDVAAGGDEA